MQRYRPGTALIVVDVQNDFADPAGSLTVAGGDAIIPTINGEIAMAVNNGAIVVATQDWHPETTPHFAKDGGIWPVHCVADTWGAALHPDLRLPDDAPRVRKGVNGEDGYSGFTMRDPLTGETDRRPSSRGCSATPASSASSSSGLATDYCVKATALDAVAPRVRDGASWPTRSRPWTSSPATASGRSTRWPRPASTMWRTVMR